MSSAERSRRNPFAGHALERCVEHRDDADWLCARRASPRARFLALDDDGRAPVRDARLFWLDTGAVAPDAQASLLGVRDEAPLFVLHDAANANADGVQRATLREAGLALDVFDAGVFAYAQGLRNWQQATRYCAACGDALKLVAAGHRAECAQCGRLHFPRTDAAVIVIVEHGDACLLGRQKTWPPGRYATLAGFVEPGESLEDAVCREVREETGVEVIDCDYHSSQPWPFPASLMLGFTATAASRGIALTDGELEDARWFTAGQIVDAVRAGTLGLSPPLSISYRLIEHWLRAHGVELAGLARAR